MSKEKKKASEKMEEMAALQAQRAIVTANIATAKQIAIGLFGTVAGNQRATINGVYDRCFDEDGLIDDEVKYLKSCIEDAKQLYGEGSPEAAFDLYDYIYAVDDFDDEDEDDEDEDEYEDA